MNLGEGEVSRLVLKFYSSRVFVRYCISKFITSKMFITMTFLPHRLFC